MNKRILAAILMWGACTTVIAQPRHILTGKYPRPSIQGLVAPLKDFHPCPMAGQWNGLDEKLKDEQVKNAEKLLHNSWGELKATTFLEYKQNGNRSNYEAVSLTRRISLNSLVSAEALENKGRFIPDIVNGIWAICEESYWGVPAHINLQKDQSGLPDITEPIVDLFTSETAALLAWTEYLLKPQLDKVSPLICRRIDIEERRRFLDAVASRNDYWWMGYLDKTPKPNNWNPWIMSNYLAASLLLEHDQARRDSAVYRTMEILDHYLDLYPRDGGCDEGPAYWFRAAASLFDCLDLLDEATGGKINVKEAGLVDAMGAYIYKLYIGKDDYFVNFADAGPKSGAGLDGGMIYRYGKYVSDSVMMKFGAFIAKDRGLIPNPFAATIGRKLRTFVACHEIMNARSEEPLVRDNWLPDLQIMTARSLAWSDKGLYVAAKGGHNAESHNHNDVGSFVVYADAEPLLIDLGPEGYTAKTFSAQRYDIWTMQSQYHNLPSVNGVMEKDGREYAAAGVTYHQTDKEAVFSLDISKAYPEEAKLTYWKRTITLQRSQAVIIRDNYKLRSWVRPTMLYFMTDHAVDAGTPGKILLTKNGRSFEMLYDKHKYTAAAENVFEADSSRNNSMIKISWGKDVSRIILTTKDHALSNDAAIVIRYARKP
jgi:hypothetical protein